MTEGLTKEDGPVGSGMILASIIIRSLHRGGEVVVMIDVEGSLDARDQWSARHRIFEELVWPGVYQDWQLHERRIA